MVKEIARNSDGIAWLLWGKFAQESFEPIIKEAVENHGRLHKIIKSPHPAAEVYGSMKAGFTGSNCFVKCNQYLSDFKPPIKWIGKL